MFIACSYYKRDCCIWVYWESALHRHSLLLFFLITGDIIRLMQPHYFWYGHFVWVNSQCLNMLCTLIWICCMKKIEDKRKDMAHTCQNPKKHIPLVSLLLWHKIVAVQCFFRSLALLNFKFWWFLKKFNIQLKVFLF